MTIDQVIKYFGNHSRACHAIGLPHQSYYNWVRQGYVSINSQFAFEEVTNKKLKVDLKDYIEVMRERYEETKRDYKNFKPKKGQ